MKAVFGLVLVAGVGLAGTAVYMVQGHFESTNARLAATQAAMASATPTVEVWAVNRQVVYGERLTREDVHAVQYAEPFLPDGAFRTEPDADAAEDAEPWAALFPDGSEEVRVVLRQMEPNEPVLLAKVTEPGEDAGLTSRLSEGMRAFAISVDVSSGVSGFLRPGDEVDVYWSGSVSEGGLGERQVTQLIERGLRLVAIDQTADDNLAGVTVAQTVTVAVSPQQVANLAQAQATGSLSLSLVGQGDETVASAIEVDQRSLLGLEDAPVQLVEAAPPPPEICTRRERRGTEVLELQVPCATN